MYSVGSLALDFDLSVERFLDLEPLYQRVADRRVLDDATHLGKLSFGVQRIDRAFQTFAVVGRSEVVQTRCRAGAIFQLVG